MIEQNNPLLERIAGAMHYQCQDWGQVFTFQGKIWQGFGAFTTSLADNEHEQPIPGMGGPQSSADCARECSSGRSGVHSRIWLVKIIIGGVPINCAPSRYCRWCLVHSIIGPRWTCCSYGRTGSCCNDQRLLSGSLK